MNTKHNRPNKTSRELTGAKWRNKMYAVNKFEGWYQDFIKDGYDFKMNYATYKKKRLKGKL